MKILIVGATGTVGSLVVQRLLATGHAVRALARDPIAARAKLGSHVEIVPGDLDDPSSLRAALRTVDAASLATAGSPNLPRQEANFVDAAVESRLDHLVKLSAFGAHDWHATSEAHLRESGLRATLLRPVVFMSNLLWEAANIKAGKLPSIFGDGRISFVDPVDVADLTALALTQRAHAGETWSFGGPEALTYDDLAASFTRVLDYSIAHVRLDEQTFRTGLVAAGLPDFVAPALIATARLTAQGKFAADDEPVRRLLGRPGTRFEAWLHRHHSAFAR
jgi:(4-alkanoyl-5-oxo-2,5-dihydrofuran-3-yl)methyl phosphate reductase